MKASEAPVVVEESFDVSLDAVWKAITEIEEMRKWYLYHLDNRVDHFDDGRKSLGFNFETIAANEDVLDGRQQNSIMLWSNTNRFQEHMERVKERF